MPILTYGFERPYEMKRSLRVPDAHRAVLLRIASHVLTLLSMGSVLAALIALRTAFYVWRLHA